MNFSDKLDKARRLLDAKGISPSDSAPPLFRLLWRFGAEVPPPHFRSFAGNALLMGGFFGVTWSIAMQALRLAGWLPQRHVLSTSQNIGLFAVMLLASGSLFGLAMAWHYHRGARRNAIPAWSDFHPAVE
ncbi:DUF6404 family protein [Rhodanobacter sp. PCA2]|uniref:DUF6404 family protein n=1 Tax=Rhodanobacter sp. PCA2 TaxID=2006117 RepID=UPI0015E779E8|nr:DUF6404 family protein [Rhodanobacter sp. PCA2]